MNFNKYFLEAEKRGIKPFEVKYTSTSVLSIDIYLDQLEKYQIANDSSIAGRGIYDGKIGSFSSDRSDNKVISTMLDNIINSARFGETGNPEFFISKGRKYKKVHALSPLMETYKPEVFIELGKEISSLIRKNDSRINVSNVSIERNFGNVIFQNSNGLKLKQKSGYIVIYAFAQIQDKDQIESFGQIKLLDDLEGFSAESFAKEIAEGAIKKLGGAPVESGKYDVVFSPDCITMLLPTLLRQLSAFDVRQHLSLFEGKKDQLVLSKKLTVLENPWAGNAYSSSFDQEGIPTQKKILVNRGVIENYLYDLSEAQKAGVESTGNADSVKGNIRPSLGFVQVKKGHKSFDEVISSIKKGLYITDLEGISTGLNPQSGNYSLQAGGFLIEGGKIVRPVTLITVAGNLLTDFGKVFAVANDSKLTIYGAETPSIGIRKLSVSGK
jgi:PmbA protein